MNFKLKELSNYVLNKGGIIIGLLQFGFSIGIILTLTLLGALLVGGGVWLKGDFTNSEISIFMILFIIILGILITISMTFIQAGMLGSFRDIIIYDRIEEGYFKNYIHNMFSNFWKLLGYSILYSIFIIIFMIIVFVPLGIGLDNLYTANNFSFAFIFQLFVQLFFTFIIMLTSPFLYLSVVEGNGFSNYISLMRRNFKELVIVSAVIMFTQIIPLVNILFSFAMMIYPLYIMVLYYDISSENLYDNIIEEKY